MSLEKCFSDGSKFYYYNLSRSLQDSKEVRAAVHIEPNLHIYRSGLPVCFFNNVQQVSITDKASAAAVVSVARNHMEGVPWVMSIPHSDSVASEIFSSQEFLGEAEGAPFAMKIDGNAEFCPMVKYLSSSSEEVLSVAEDDIVTVLPLLGKEGVERGAGGQGGGGGLGSRVVRRRATSSDGSLVADAIISANGLKDNTSEHFLTPFYHMYTNSLSHSAVPAEEDTDYQHIVFGYFMEDALSESKVRVGDAIKPLAVSSASAITMPRHKSAMIVEVWNGF